MRQQPTLALAALLVASIPAAGDDVLIESPSDNRAYVIALDSEKVQQWLQPIKHTAGSFPAWLAPYQGATPTKVEVSGDRTRAYFIASGSVEQLIQYYDELLRSEGYTTRLRRRKPENASIWAMVSGDIIRVSVYIFESRTNVTIIRTLSGDKGRTGRRRLREQWYDDSRGMLLVNDLDTGEQFHLRREAFSRVATKSWPLK